MRPLSLITDRGTPSVLGRSVIHPNRSSSGRASVRHCPDDGHTQALAEPLWAGSCPSNSSKTGPRYPQVSSQCWPLVPAPLLPFWPQVPRVPCPFVSSWPSPGDHHPVGGAWSLSTVLLKYKLFPASLRPSL